MGDTAFLIPSKELPETRKNQQMFILVIAYYIKHASSSYVEKRAGALDKLKQKGVWVVTKY